MRQSHGGLCSIEESGRKAMNKTRKNHFTATIIAVVATGIASSGALAGGFMDIQFAEVSFSNESVINNPYWPLSPDGTDRSFTYVGETEDECVINTVFIDWDNTRSGFGGIYSGINALVVLDKEWLVELEDGDVCNASIDKTDEDNLTERTEDWYAQDEFQNIWYMGELSQSFEDECPAFGSPLPVPDECFEGSWEAGQPGPEEGLVAEPGIVVPSDTPFGMGTGDLLTAGTYYMQEVAEGAEDMAKILRLNAPLSVEDGIFPGEYENCRKVKEWTALEPGGSVEHKWYCHDTRGLYGPGLVLIGGIGGGVTEVETLVEISPML